MTFLTDTDGASPVIGVILLLSVTIVLAAIIGGVVLGSVSDMQTTEPRVDLQFDYNETGEGLGCPTGFRQDSFGQDAVYNYFDCGGFDEEPKIAPGDGGILSITHAGGDRIDADQLYVYGTSAYGTVAWSDSECLPDGENCNSNDDLNYAPGDAVEPTDRFDIWVENGDEIRIVWESESGSRSAVLAGFSV